ncbi:hypothetical protein J1614_004392 [Plenodomus biglobosus]|nr:hypothetical protein J1614_004392 [Plenodomus biglobosus]
MLCMSILMTLATLAVATEDWKNPKDALVNPRGQKVCMQQCGTRELLCPEAFLREQNGPCYRCCSTWGETVIRIECKDGLSANSSEIRSAGSWSGNATSSSLSNATSTSPRSVTEAHPRGDR